MKVKLVEVVVWGLGGVVWVVGGVLVCWCGFSKAVGIYCREEEPPGRLGVVVWVTGCGAGGGGGCG